MQTLLNKIKKTISTHSLIQPNAHILIGVSGGADSVALLHALVQIIRSRRSEVGKCSGEVAPQPRALGENTPTSNIQYQTSSIKHPTSNIKSSNPTPSQTKSPSTSQTPEQKPPQKHPVHPVNPCEFSYISVAHLNHNIRPEAADDAHFVEKLCHKLNIPFYTATVDVPALAAATGVSLEMAARDARYKFFAETAQQCSANAVATAHTRDDQAETLLLKLCRGAGSSGLNGIAHSIEIQGLRVIRPMLDVTRTEVEEFLTSQNITWREDATNADTKIKRNYIRHKILPQLEKHLNPRIKEALARTATILRDDNAYMETQAATALTNATLPRSSGFLPDQTHPHPSNPCPSESISGSNCHFSEQKPPQKHPVHPVHPCKLPQTEHPPPKTNSLNSNNSRLNPPHTLSIPHLRPLPPAILRRTLRQWLIEQQTPADKMRFDLIERTIELIFSEKGTGSITLTANTEITREYDLLSIIETKTKTTPIKKTELTIPGKTKIESHNLTITATLRKGFERIQTNTIGQLPATVTIRWDNPIPPAIHIRSWLPGDRMQPLGMKGSCKLKELFINAKIPQSERQNIPIFTCNNEIIWIPGYRISRNYAVTDQQQQSLQLNIDKKDVK